LWRGCEAGFGAYRPALVSLRVIKSCGNDFARAAGERCFAKGVPQDVLKVANRKLLQLAAAQDLDDLRVPPGDRLEALSGDLRGWHRIRVNDQWRVVFRWHDGNAHEVSVVDYQR